MMENKSYFYLLICICNTCNRYEWWMFSFFPFLDWGNDNLCLSNLIWISNLFCGDYDWYWLRPRLRWLPVSVSPRWVLTVSSAGPRSHAAMLSEGLCNILPHYLIHNWYLSCLDTIYWYCNIHWSFIAPKWLRRFNYDMSYENDAIT